MSAKVIYERFLWFHTQVKQGNFPNATSLAAYFEIAPKTAQRDIEFMRDRLYAPLQYAPPRRGYRYEDDSYQLPGLWLKESEVVSLLVSARLAAAIPDGALKSSLQKFLNQIFSLHTLSTTLSLEQLHRKVSVKNIEYYRTDEKVYHQVLDALLHNRPLRIEYYSPHTGAQTRRDILPLHMLAYMGTWHLIAHCNMRNELRDFALSRIRGIEPSACAIAIADDHRSLTEYLREHFGILRGSAINKVTIRFAPAIAPWIREQVWHPHQQIASEPDGAITLSFPASDLREVKREVLRYGAQAEVIAPPALRNEIAAEIKKMQNIYLVGHSMGDQV